MQKYSHVFNQRAWKRVCFHQSIANYILLLVLLPKWLRKYVSKSLSYDFDIMSIWRIFLKAAWLGLNKICPPRICPSFQPKTNNLPCQAYCRRWSYRSWKWHLQNLSDFTKKKMKKTPQKLNQSCSDKTRHGSSTCYYHLAASSSKVIFYSL